MKKMILSTLLCFMAVSQVTYASSNEKPTEARVKLSKLDSKSSGLIYNFINLDSTDGEISSGDDGKGTAFNIVSEDISCTKREINDVSVYSCDKFSAGLTGDLAQVIYESLAETETIDDITIKRGHVSCLSKSKAYKLTTYSCE